MSCLLSSRYTCLADLYSKTNSVSSSGQIKSAWTFQETVECQPVTIVNSGTKSLSNNEGFNQLYVAIDSLFLNSRLAIGRQQRVTNIRNKKTGTLIYREEELASGPGTVFNCNGSVPQIDPFGKLVEFKSFLERAQVQDID